MYLGVLFVKIRTSVLNLFLVDQDGYVTCKNIFLVEFKDRSPVRRQRIRKGVWLAIALALLGAGGERMLAALVEPMPESRIRE